MRQLRGNPCLAKQSPNFVRTRLLSCRECFDCNSASKIQVIASKQQTLSALLHWVKIGVFLVVV